MAGAVSLARPGRCARDAGRSDRERLGVPNYSLSFQTRSASPRRADQARAAARSLIYRAKLRRDERTRRLSARNCCAGADGGPGPPPLPRLKEIRVKRLQFMAGSNDLDRSIGFNSTMSAPADRRKDDMPSGCWTTHASHFAIQTGSTELPASSTWWSEESVEALDEDMAASRRRPASHRRRPDDCFYAKAKRAGLPPRRMVCGAFFTDGEATVYGDRPPLGALSDSAARQCFFSAGAIAA